MKLCTVFESRKIKRWTNVCIKMNFTNCNEIHLKRNAVSHSFSHKWFSVFNVLLWVTNGSYRGFMNLVHHAIKRIQLKKILVTHFKCISVCFIAYEKCKSFNVLKSFLKRIISCVRKTDRNVFYHKNNSRTWLTNSLGLSN